MTRKPRLTEEEIAKLRHLERVSEERIGGMHGVTAVGDVSVLTKYMGPGDSYLSVMLQDGHEVGATTTFRAIIKLDDRTLPSCQGTREELQTVLAEVRVPEEA